MARPTLRSRSRASITSLALAALLSQGLPATARAADADTVAPTTPTDLHVVSRAKSGSITLGWTASSDAVGVAGYRMSRDGTSLGTLYQAGVDILGCVWYDRLGPRIKAPVTYRLTAFDAAGNASAAALLVVVP